MQLASSDRRTQRSSGRSSSIVAESSKTASSAQESDVHFPSTHSEGEIYGQWYR